MWARVKLWKTGAVHARGINVRPGRPATAATTVMASRLQCIGMTLDRSVSLSIWLSVFQHYQPMLFSRCPITITWLICSDNPCQYHRIFFLFFFLDREFPLILPFSPFPVAFCIRSSDRLPYQHRVFSIESWELTHRSWRQWRGSWKNGNSCKAKST